MAIFDADGDKINANERAKHEVDNRNLLSLLGDNAADPFPAAVVSHNKFVQWPANLGTTLRSEVDRAMWDKTFGQVSRALGNPTGSLAKNPIHTALHLQMLENEKSVPPSLEKLAAHVLAFAHG